MYSPFSLKRERLYPVKDKIIIEWNPVNTAMKCNRPYKFGLINWWHTLVSLKGYC